MENILVINAGSTSLKFSIFLASRREGQASIDEFRLLHSGQLDKVDDDIFTMKVDGEKREINGEDFEYAIWRIKEVLFPEIKFDLIGFRVVHGGEKFISPTLLDSAIVREIEALNNLAPLHNPPVIARIKQTFEAYPEIPKYAIFDTEFHSTVPEKAYLYALPYKFYKQYKIRRYGFHGISHEFLFSQIEQLIANSEMRKRVITCHLGGGASITAIKNGQSVDTSMGFTPMEGVVMATRTGDVDDGVQNYLEKNLGMSEDEINRVFNKESGLLGLSEVSSDMVKLIGLYKQGNPAAIRALDVYIYRVQKYIGSYVAVLGGLDVLVFSGGVGSGSDFIRKKVCEGLSVFGIEVDDLKNDGKLNIENSIEIGRGKVKIFAIKTNEELMIAKKVRYSLSS
ncbi:acetate/propionate family kinase [Candidatus Dojkabacteria bacterium]|nr:acetate/propionate family kinase [Candidatus Dojkabacteria bacterium]